ncbi:MAG: class II fructose-bisphosphatase [Cyanobacteria bacterium NC_groundwater_1444_Ag_S-0.65um_54_12]|nr:class II fructose-bisphosphatase [Cyanobacteria bacterium NC_groundwater_1444_Ag_S-0.65um_54_12]
MADVDSLERRLSIDLVGVVEAAALAAGRLMGQGDNMAADHAATEAMREAFNHLNISGTIVIGEGERDEAPMLYIGEQVGKGGTAVDIAVDPLEGTNLVARGLPNSIAVMAVSEQGGLLHAPDTYMEKLIVGPAAAGKVDITAPVKTNLAIIAMSMNREIEDLTIVILDRPRHKELIDEVRAAGARIRLIGDGDVTAAISSAVRGTAVHGVFGVGGAPEGVLAAAALKCLGGEIQARLKPRNAAEAERCKSMGIDLDKVYTTDELAPGKQLIFAATGITEGDILHGVRYFGSGCRTYSLLMTLTTGVISFVDRVHLQDRHAPVILERF